MTLDLGILLSGSGSNFQAILDSIAAGKLHARVRLVIANTSNAYGLLRAEKAGIATCVLAHQDFSSREEFDQALVERLQQAGVQVVVLAGFMRIVTPVLLRAFPAGVLNIHPSLLPACPGVQAQKQQADYGVRLAGCTVHFVDEELDHGPIIIQAAVPAFAADDAQTLGQRILELEHRIYPQALEWLAQGRLSLKGRQVELKSQSPAGKSRFWTHPPLDAAFAEEKA